MEQLLKGGLMMIPLALSRVVAAVVAFERIFALRRSKVVPPHIAEVAELALPDRDLSVAIEVCRRNPGVFSNILLVGLESSNLPWEHAREAVLEAGRQETPHLERNLVWLETVAGVAPLLGLLGTVLGMIKTFAAIASVGLGDPTVLSAGISEAMITTATGLGIGIPALIFHNLLSARAENLVIEIEQRVSRMLARWKPQESGSA